jgi:hypothetical protein
MRGASAEEAQGSVGGAPAEKKGREREEQQLAAAKPRLLRRSRAAAADAHSQTKQPGMRVALTARRDSSCCVGAKSAHDARQRVLYDNL